MFGRNRFIIKIEERIITLEERKGENIYEAYSDLQYIIKFLDANPKLPTFCILK